MYKIIKNFFNFLRTKFSDLNDYLEKINRAEAESVKRNEELLKEISNVIKQADSHNRKTEQLLKIRVSLPLSKILSFLYFLVITCYRMVLELPV